MKHAKRIIALTMIMLISMMTFAAYGEEAFSGTGLFAYAATEADEDQAEAAGEPSAVLEYKGDGYNATVEGSGLSEDTQFTAEEIGDGDDDYDAYRSAALRAVGGTEESLGYVKIFDIALTEADGSAAELDEPAAVDISFGNKLANELRTEDEDNVSIVRIDMNGGNADAEVLGNDETSLSVRNDDLTEAGFGTESGGVYAVLYTVDFHYGDGEYDFSIAGESDILLSAVLSRLHIEDVQLADVTDVTFSDPELVRVEKKDSDWLLTSLRPFNTDETLTVTMAGGSVITINVTDAQAACTLKNGNNTIGSYATLNEAFAAMQKNNNGEVTTNYVIELLQDCSINEPIVFSGNINGRTLSIKPASGVNNPVIYRNFSDGDAITIKKGALTLQSVCFDGKGDSFKSSGSLVKVSGTASITMESVVVRNHNASDDACAVDVSNSGGNVIVKGKTKITRNYSSKGEANLKAKDNPGTMYFDETLSEDIGISGIAAVNSQFGMRRNTATGLEHLKADNHPSWVAATANNNATSQLYWRTNICQVNDNGTKTQYTSIANAYSAATEGSRIEMLIDYELPSAISFSSSKTVTLTTAQEYRDTHNGRNATISRAGSFSNTMMTVSGGSVTLTDITLDGEDVTVNGNGGLVQLTGGTLTLESGAVLKNGHAGNDGGAVFINNNGNLIMNAGSIKNCSADDGSNHAGGGIDLWDHCNGSLTINGGVIDGCKATNAGGGGIGIGHGKDAVINDVRIINCEAAKNGAAIEIHGSLYMNGGEITGNKTLGNGGAINFFNNTRYIYFSGSPRIYGNKDSNDKERNVDIYYHAGGEGKTTNCIQIQAGKGLNEDAVIGVTAAPKNDPMAGESGQFGTYENGANLDNVNSFVNDVNGGLYGADGGSNKLIWAQGVTLMAKAYVSDPAKAIEIPNSKGTYGFRFPSNSNTVEKSISVIESEYNAKLGYLDEVNYGDTAEFRYGLKKGVAEHITYIKSVLDRNTLKCTNYYKTETSGYTSLEQGAEVTLYYQVRPEVTICVADYDDRKTKIDGAEFELYDSHNNRIWTGKTADGKVTINWAEAEGGSTQGATFEAGSTYTLKQVSTDEEHVLPGGSWRLTVSTTDLGIGAETNASPAGTNRTLDMATAKNAEFDLYNDTQPSVIYEAAGGEFTGTTPDVVVFGTSDTSADYTVTTHAPVQNNKAFNGWVDGKGNTYQSGEKITNIFRQSDNDDITLSAQWTDCKALTVINENTGDYSNADDSFEVTVILKANDADLTGRDDARLAGIKLNGNNTDTEDWSYSDSEKTAACTFTLDGRKSGNAPADSAQAVISGVPVGWTYTVSEETGEDGRTSGGYVVAYKGKGDSDYTSGRNGWSGTLEDDATVNIKHTRSGNEVVPSGINAGNSIGLVLVMIVIVLMTAECYILRRLRLARRAVR